MVFYRKLKDITLGLTSPINTATIEWPLTNQMRLIFPITQSDA